MNFARTIRFDNSDDNVFARAAQPGEWAVSGAFAFADLPPDVLIGKERQAFANGFLGLGSFGRATFVVAATITPEQLEAAEGTLARHLLTEYGAPDMATALEAAREETAFIIDLCAEVRPGVVFAVSRETNEAGEIKESFRMIERPKTAPLVPTQIWGIEPDDG
ncbi:MAG: DUF6505 family protein [Dichotomicrobium sp.]